MENLKPNTKYYYKVGNKELGVWSDVYEMTTADNTTNDAKFLLMADPQSSTYSAAYPKSVMLEKIMKENPDGEFLMSAGDLIIDPELEDQWITTFGVNSFATPSITNLVAPGNHDTRCEDGHESDETAFAKHFNMPVPESATSGKTYFSVDYKDMHIAVLDTTRLPYDANEDTEQIPWLRENMKNTDKKWKIVLTHISPQTTISVGPEGSGAYRRRKSLQPIFTELGVDLVLAGDSHLYTRTYPFKNCVKNENPTIVKTQTDGGVTTKFYDSSEGVTYVTLGSVSTQTGTYLEESLASVYDVVLTETGCTKEDLYNISTYNIAEVKGDDIIISVYHYDETTGESTLFDKFGITKTNKN